MRVPSGRRSVLVAAVGLLAVACGTTLGPTPIVIYVTPAPTLSSGPTDVASIAPSSAATTPSGSGSAVHDVGSDYAVVFPAGGNGSVAVGAFKKAGPNCGSSSAGPGNIY